MIIKPLPIRLTSNRTILELKSVGVKIIEEKDASSNRTILELKSQQPPQHPTQQPPSNRTILELKFKLLLR